MAARIIKGWGDFPIRGDEEYEIAPEFLARIKPLLVADNDWRKVKKPLSCRYGGPIGKPADSV